MYTKEDITIDKIEFSQKEIADKLNVTIETVNRWYQRRKRKMTNGDKIPDALNFLNLSVILGIE